MSENQMVKINARVVIVNGRLFYYDPCLFDTGNPEDVQFLFSLAKRVAPWQPDRMAYVHQDSGGAVTLDSRSLDDFLETLSPEEKQAAQSSLSQS